MGEGKLRKIKSNNKIVKLKLIKVKLETRSSEYLKQILTAVRLKFELIQINIKLIEALEVERLRKRYGKSHRKS